MYDVGPEHRANPESALDGAVTWTHQKHTFRFGAEYLYENRLETNQYEQFSSSATQTCPTNASGLFTCGSGQGNGLASMLLDLPSALTVNVPQYEEIHARMTPIGVFVQDEWHPFANLTVNVGLRYDYDPAVKLLVSNGETVNAFNIPGGQYIIRLTGNLGLFHRLRRHGDAAMRSGRLEQFQPRIQRDGRWSDLQHPE